MKTNLRGRDFGQPEGRSLVTGWLEGEVKKNFDILSSV